jgi:hypothetical protein
MGLAVVHGIAHEHAGHVGVVSHARTGTSISLYLPVGAPKVPQRDGTLSENSEAPPLSTTASTDSGAQIPPAPSSVRKISEITAVTQNEAAHVLVVDDETALRELLRIQLGTWGTPSVVGTTAKPPLTACSTIRTNSMWSSSTRLCLGCSVRR